MHSASEMRPDIGELKLERPNTASYVGSNHECCSNSLLEYIICFCAGGIVSGSLTFLLIKAFGG